MQVLLGFAWSHFSVTALLLGNIASFFIGIVWYGPFFGSAWAHEAKIDVAKVHEEIRAGRVNMKSLFAQGFLLNLLTNLYSVVLFHTSDSRVGHTSFVKVFPHLFVFVLFAWIQGFNCCVWERKSVLYWAINCGYLLAASSTFLAVYSVVFSVLFA